MDVVWEHASNNSLSHNALARAALAAYTTTWIEGGFPGPENMTMEDADNFAPRGPHIAAETLMAYVIERRQFIGECEILAIEKPFAVPLYEDVPDLFYIGREDKIVRHRQHGTLAIEHKTSTSYAAGKTGRGSRGTFRQSYIDSYSPNSQVDGYAHAGNMLYENFKGVWVDAALFHKKWHDIFKFIPIDRSIASLEEWLHETRNWINRVEEEKDRYEEHGLLGSFPKNTGSCGDFGGCTYRDICKFYSNPDLDAVPAGYVINRWNPFDVLKLAQLGMEAEEKV